MFYSNRFVLNRFISSGHRPTYCNVCRDLSKYIFKRNSPLFLEYSIIDQNFHFKPQRLSISVTSHGLSCEVCKCKAHKRCAAKAIANW